MGVTAASSLASSISRKVLRTTSLGSMEAARRASETWPFGRGAQRHILADTLCVTIDERQAEVALKPSNLEPDVRDPVPRTSVRKRWEAVYVP